MAEDHELLADVWARISPSVTKPRLMYSFWVCIMAAVGGFAFGYDLGVLASILAMPRFQESLHLTEDDKTNIVGTFLIGCTFGSMLQGVASDKFGRKWSIIIGSVVSAIGGAFQTFATSVWLLFIGRFVAGFAIGMFSALVPVYMAECVIFTFRGQMVTFQQLMIVLGVAGAYWADFITFKLYGENDWQWRGPLFIQVVLGVFIFVGVMFLPKSPRWLLSKGRNDESLKSLAALRMLPEDNEYVQTEFEEMKWSLQREIEIGTTTYKELVSDKYLRKRLIIMSIVNAYQQFCGINGVNYYAPKFYQNLQVGGTDSVLLLQGFYGILKLVMTIPTFFIVDRFGRRPLLMFGGIIMAISMLGLGTLFAVTTGGDSKNVTLLVQNPSLRILGVFFIWFFVVGFNSSWGPITWVVSSEVFPLRVRSKAISITAGIQWACNTITVYVVPLSLKSHSYGIFIGLGLVSISSIPFVYFFLPETRNRTLEEMDIVWGVKREIDIEVATSDEKKTAIIDEAPAKTA